MTKRSELKRLRARNEQLEHTLHIALEAGNDVADHLRKTLKTNKILQTEIKALKRK